jgi:uracil-DNA glycosylase
MHYSYRSKRSLHGLKLCVKNNTIKIYTGFHRTGAQMLKTLLHSDWKHYLWDRVNAEAVNRLETFLQNEMNETLILPEQAQWFASLNLTPLNQTKVVILGQDPYPTPGHAHGLCFSVQADVSPLPKSLANIYKELLSDEGIDNRDYGCLTKWAEQGVLLLNTVLTVRAKHANSHQDKGWETITDEIIKIVNQQQHNCVFILWGAYAQKKERLIDSQRHLIIKSPHPSPLSAYRGFFDSRPFSKCNQYLSRQGKKPIDWRVGVQMNLI